MLIFYISFYFLILISNAVFKTSKKEKARPICINANTNKTINDKIYLQSEFQIFNETLKIICQWNSSAPSSSLLSSSKKTFTYLNYSLYNVLGFSVRGPKLFTVNNASMLELKITFVFTYFDFYRNGMINRWNRVNMSSSQDLIASFHGLKNLTNQNITQLYNEFETMIPNHRFYLYIAAANLIRTKMSRILLKNAQLIELCIHKLTNTSMRKYLFEIEQIDDLFDFNYEQQFVMNKSSNINFARLRSSILVLFYFDVYNIYFDERFLDKFVFKHTRNLEIDGFISGVSDYAFKSLKELSLVSFKIQCLKEFIHSSADHKWMIYLNENGKHNFTLANNYDLNKTVLTFMKNNYFVLRFQDRSNSYDFPNEDICLFRNFPHQNTVFFSIEDIELENNLEKNKTIHVKTCTLYHLSKFSNLMEFINPFMFVNFFEYDNQSLKDCDLDQQIQKCLLNSTLNDLNFKPLNIWDISDIVAFLEWIELIGSIYSFPIISMCGIISNLLVVIVIKSKKSESIIDPTKANKRMYTYIVINSILNIIECFISSFTLMSECLGWESLFCSSISHINFIQYFRIYFVSYFGVVIKTSSAIMMLLFSLERFRITSQSKNVLIEKLTSCSIVLTVALTLLLSLLTSANKIFEYRTKGNYYSQLEFPSLNMFDLIESKHWFIVFIYLFHYIFNDFFLLILNLIIDIRLVILVRRDLSTKRRFAIKNFNSNKSSNVSTVLEKNLKKTLDEISVAEKNTNKMIIYSFIVYLLCRLPELCLYFYLILCDESIVFVIHSLGPVAINVVECMYVLSYSFNLFFYFKFNKNFRDAFKNFFNISQTTQTTKLTNLHQK